MGLFHSFYFHLLYIFLMVHDQHSDNYNMAQKEKKQKINLLSQYGDIY